MGTDVDTDTVDTDTVDTTVTPTEVTDTDTTWARGPLIPNPRLMLKPLSCTPATLDTDTDTVLVPIVDMVLVDTTAMPDTDTVLVHTDTVDTTAVDTTVTPDTDTVTAVTTVRKFANHCYFLPFFVN